MLPIAWRLPAILSSARCAPRCGCPFHVVFTLAHLALSNGHFSLSSSKCRPLLAIFFNIFTLYAIFLGIENIAYYLPVHAANRMPYFIRTSPLYSPLHITCYKCFCYMACRTSLILMRCSYCLMATRLRQVTSWLVGKLASKRTKTSHISKHVNILLNIIQTTCNW